MAIFRGAASADAFLSPIFQGSDTANFRERDPMLLFRFLVRGLEHDFTNAAIPSMFVYSLRRSPQQSQMKTCVAAAILVVSFAARTLAEEIYVVCDPASYKSEVEASFLPPASSLELLIFFSCFCGLVLSSTSPPLHSGNDLSATCAYFLLAYGALPTSRSGF